MGFRVMLVSASSVLRYWEEAWNPIKSIRQGFIKSDNSETWSSWAGEHGIGRNPGMCLHLSHHDL